MKIAYCDCFSGISGDMFLGALIDAGLPFEMVKQEIAKLNLLEEIQLCAVQVMKGSMRAMQFEVQIAEHAHDTHPEHHAHHHHQHRTMRDIAELIQTSALSDRVKETSLAIFNCLAEAEARVHGVPRDEVHFHEVGAVDSIIDIVGAAVGLEYFGIEALYASALPVGEGSINTQHGLLPVPAPATLELLKMSNASLRPTNTNAEQVTPTGAAILAALAKYRMPNMTLQQIGIGAGKRDLDWPNIFRVLIGETVDIHRN
jgi:pyridinium-3,5-bisthiocarboxylic acid mononucleotide nickel chelatase